MKSIKTMGNPEVLRFLGDETRARAKVFSEEQEGLECSTFTSHALNSDGPR
jgi:hypothetical protein